jgi:hypothetical protein
MDQRDDMIKLTAEREIAPYAWVHPDEDRRSNETRARLATHPSLDDLLDRRRLMPGCDRYLPVV